MRLVGRPVDVFQYLEPLYNDFRKVRLRDSYGNFQLSYIDQVLLFFSFSEEEGAWAIDLLFCRCPPATSMASSQTSSATPSGSPCSFLLSSLQVVDDMLHKDYCFDIALPRLPARRVLEETGQIEPRVSLLQDEFEAQVELEEKEDAARREREAAEAPGDAKEAGEVGPNDQGAGDGKTTIAGTEAKDREPRRRSPSPWRMSERERREDRARKRAAVEVSGDDRRGRRGEEGPRTRHDDDYRSRREDDRHACRYWDDSRDGDRHRRRYRDDSREDRRRASERDGRDRRRRRSRTPSRSPDRHRRRKDQGLTRAAEAPASEEALEIAEANKLRASLGLKPLRM